MRSIRIPAFLALTAVLVFALAVPAFADNLLTGTERSNIAAFAKSQVGKPYLSGPASLKINPKTGNRVRAGYDKYDCSGLTWRAYKDKAGMYIGGNPMTTTVKWQCATATDQYHAAPRKFSSSSSARLGDLAFWRDSSGNISHVGVLIGGGRIVDATSSYGKVVNETLSAFAARAQKNGKSVTYGGWYDYTSRNLR